MFSVLASTQLHRVCKRGYSADLDGKPYFCTTSYDMIDPLNKARPYKVFSLVHHSIRQSKSKWKLSSLPIQQQNNNKVFDNITIKIRQNWQIYRQLKSDRLSNSFPAQHLVLAWFTSFQVYLHLPVVRVYKGYLLNEWVTKHFGNIQKGANLSALSPVFSSCIIYTLFGEISRYLQIPLTDFCDTSHSRRQALKV